MGESWSVGGAGVMAEEVVWAMARLSETLAEKVLMVAISPAGKGKGYFMDPLYPEIPLHSLQCSRLSAVGCPTP